MSLENSKMKRRLKFATFFTIVAFFILCGLGTWQVARLQYKLHKIALVEERAALEPIALPLNETLNLDQWEYRRVFLSGRFLHEKEHYLFVGARQIRGKVGYDIMTPMQVAENHYVLVDRGWVPFDKKLPEDRPETLILGDDIPVVGMIQKSETPGRFTPENDVNKNTWFWIDVKAMLQGFESNVPTTHYYIRQLQTEDKQGAGVWPIAGEAKVHYRNDHLQYAITWYSLAIILVIVYGAFRRSLLNKKDSKKNTNRNA